MKIAIVGTRGIPNNYGGFETLVENLTANLSKDYEITVFCSSKDIKTKFKEYNGAKLRYIPISSHGAAGILYDSISLLRTLPFYNKVLLLGFGGGFIIPFLKKYKNKLILNMGGLDWKRSKWSLITQKCIKFAERTLVQNSGIVVSDNIGIENYLTKEYGVKSILIEYGGDQAKKKSITEEFAKRYSFLRSEYAFTVTRIQSDNNIEMILNAFSKTKKIPFVIVGNWNNSSYGKRIKSKYLHQNNLFLLDAIYNRDILDILRSNCKYYVHGHSAGGTNPTLVEAMYLGLPVLAYASEYNEYTTEGKAIYFEDEKDLMNKINNNEEYNLVKIGTALNCIANKRYKWEIICKKYKEVFSA